MDRTDEAGAVAAAEYFMELYHYVLVSGDTYGWTQQTVAGSCEFCAAVAEQSTADSAEGLQIRLPPFEVNSVHLRGFDSTFRIHAVELTYSTAGGQVIDGSGTPVDVINADEGTLLLDLGRAPQGWELVGAQRIVGGSA